MHTAIGAGSATDIVAFVCARFMLHQRIVAMLASGNTTYSSFLRSRPLAAEVVICSHLLDKAM